MQADAFAWIVLIGSVAFFVATVVRKKRGWVLPDPFPWSWGRPLILVGLIVFAGTVFAHIDFAPKLSHMDLVVLSGPTSGHNYTLVDRLSANAVKRKGSIKNVETEGAADNIQRLIDAADQPLFALVQDGIPYPEDSGLAMVARLPNPETVFFLGLNGERIRRFADLKGMRIGIGPGHSGSALLARHILGANGSGALNLILSEHPFPEQVEMLRRGELDLGVFVMNVAAPLIESALRDGLQIASFKNIDALPNHVPAARIEWLHAGHYDYVRELPPVAKKVMRVDTLVLSNGRASRSDVIALLVLLNDVFHGFIEYNRDTPNHTSLPVATDLKLFLENDGPSLLDEYAPVLVDFIPAANFIHFFMAISILLNVMAAWNRYRLWRVDTARVELENVVFSIFSSRLTVEEIAQLHPAKGEFNREQLRRLDKLVLDYDRLRRRCRRYSLSFLVPMGQENIYRFHEDLISRRLAVLRDLRGRVRTRSKRPRPSNRGGTHRKA